MEVQEQENLLKLFTEQQTRIIRRESDQVMILVASIQKQAEFVNRIRSRREVLSAQLVPRARVKRVVRLGELAARFSAASQPVLKSLIEDLMRLSDQVRRKANQNQVLLARSIEVIRDLLEELTPTNPARTYENDGRVKISLIGTAAAYRT